MKILYPDLRPGVDTEIENKIAGPNVHLDTYRFTNANDVPEAAWRTCDAIVVNARMDLTEAVAAMVTNCRIVVRTGVGYDRVDLEAFAKRGIPVCNTPDYGTTEVADTAIAMMLSFARGISAYQNPLRANLHTGWNFAIAKTVRRLRGATFGVIGLGRIGTAAARRAAAFDMKVAFYDPHLSNGTELSLGLQRTRTLHDLLNIADCVSIHAPLTEETDGLIDEQAIHAMRPGAILINTARGPIVNLQAVYNGLSRGHLGAVGLDTVPQEPPNPEDPLFKAWCAQEPWLADRLLLTPHAGFYSDPALQDMRSKSLETALDFLNTHTLKNCVNGVTATKRATP